MTVAIILTVKKLDSVRNKPSENNCRRSANQMAKNSAKENRRFILNYTEKNSMSSKHTVETASTTVEICDLSPHSAINVKTKAFKKTGLMKIVKNFSVFFKQLKLSSSSWITGSSLSGEVRLLVVLISLTCAIGSVSLGEFELRTISTTICGLSTSFKSVVEFLRNRTRNSSSSSLKIT